MRQITRPFLAGLLALTLAVARDTPLADQRRACGKPFGRGRAFCQQYPGGARFGLFQFLDAQAVAARRYFSPADGRAPDIQVSGEITRIVREPISYATNDVLTPQEYRLTLVARAQARDLTTGKTNFNRSFQGQTFLRAGNDLPSSEREAMPMLDG